MQRRFMATKWQSTITKKTWDEGAVTCHKSAALSLQFLCFRAENVPGPSQTEEGSLPLPFLYRSSVLGHRMFLELPKTEERSLPLPFHYSSSVLVHWMFLDLPKTEEGSLHCPSCTSPLSFRAQNVGGPPQNRGTSMAVKCHEMNCNSGCRFWHCILDYRWW